MTTVATMTFPDQVKLILIDKLAVAIVVLFGAFVLNRLLERYKMQQARTKELEMMRITAVRAYVQRQIEELYSPLFAAVQRSQQFYDIACAKVASMKESPEGRKKEPEVWRWFVETYFLPLNQEATELIRKKIYLLENGVLPASFAQFMRHAAHYECLHRLWKELEEPSRNIKGDDWPATFQKEVEDMLAILRKRHEAHAQAVAKPA